MTYEKKSNGNAPPGAEAPCRSLASMESLLAEIKGKTNDIFTICQTHQNMLQSLLERSPPAHLDSCTTPEQNPPAFVMTEGSSDIMAKEHRLRVQIGTTEDGLPITKQVSAKSELELADKAVEAIIQSGRIYDFLPRENVLPPEVTKVTPEVKKTSFREYTRRWRSTYKQGKAVNTEVFLDSKQNILLRWFGEMNIEDIRPDDVQAFLNERASKYKRATVKADWAMLKEILSSAVNDDIIAKNPAKDRRVHNPAEEGSGTKALTREQITAIQKAIPTLKDDNERCLIALLAYTSMRREEVLGLRWEHVDFEAKKLTICEAVVYPINAPVSKTTKTKSSQREFPMSKALCDLLRPFKREKGYVISGEGGKAISSVEYNRLWKSLSSHIELYGMTAINFRTTFATMAVASGVDIRTAQSLMGHSTPEMTLKVYTKKEESRLPAAVKQLEEFLQDD